MPEALYKNVKLRLRAVVNGIEFNDVVQWSASMELNAIPSGNLLVAVGRRVDNVEKAATIHTAVDKLRIKVPAQVYLQVIPHGSSPGVEHEWPREEFPIFIGYAVGTGWQRANGQAQFIIHLMHWLADLNCSSSLSATCHPHCHADVAYSAVVPNINISGTGVDDPQWIPMCDAQRGITADLLQTDLWGKVLYPWLEQLASQDRIDLQVAGGAGISRGLNDRAKQALSRMAPGSNCYTPLQLDVTGANGDAVSNGVRESLRRQSFSSWVNTTLWGKLVGEFAPNYFFSVVPRVETALVVPFSGTLSGPVFKTIQPSEYDFCRLAAQLPQVLQAVGVMHATQMLGASDMNAGSYPVTYKRIAGWYEPELADGEEVGMILTKDAPDWLSDLVPEASYSRASSGADGRAVRTAFDPDAGNAREGVAPDEAIKSVIEGGVLNRYAHHWYAMETLKGRMAELSGKLRFDIAPGSLLKIVGGAERFIGLADQLAVPSFASVVRVSSAINAESQQAGTSFTLAHVRTEAENSSPRTSVSRPPLYLAGWSGCTLQDAFT